MPEPAQHDPDERRTHADRREQDGRRALDTLIEAAKARPELRDAARIVHAEALRLHRERAELRAVLVDVVDAIRRSKSMQGRAYDALGARALKVLNDTAPWATEGSA